MLAIATGGLSGMAGWLDMPFAGRLASVLWCVLLVVVIHLEQRSAHARRRIPWALGLLVAWVASIVLVLYWRPLGIDLTAIASLDSAVITMFMPLSLAGGALIAWAVFRLVPARYREMTAYAGTLAIAAVGASLTTSIVNPVTVFTTPADLRAMHWIDRNVDGRALFAVDSRPWLGPARSGVDGGYWIGVATGCRSILPPLLYAWSLPAVDVERINARLRWWSETAIDATTFEILRDAGVTHIYVGPYGERWKRDALLGSDQVRVVYRDAGVAVFEIVR
jgi:hypothetical protein